MTGVGLIGVILLSLFFDSLYKETFPPVTGVSKALHASEIPLHEEESCQYPISVSGEEKFKLFVIATGSAPTQLTFLADSATAAIVPLKGSRETHLLLQSTEAERQRIIYLYFSHFVLLILLLPHLIHQV